MKAKSYSTWQHVPSAPCFIPCIIFLGKAAHLQSLGAFCQADATAEGCGVPPGLVPAGRCLREIRVRLVRPWPVESGGRRYFEVWTLPGGLWLSRPM